jgi:seryl-tRNA synthetase
MHDLKAIRENPEAFDAAMKRRALEGVARMFVEMDAQRRNVVQLLQNEQELRNDIAKQIAQAKRSNSDSSELSKSMEKAQEHRVALKKLDEKLLSVQKNLNDFSLNIPNILDLDVPDGINESQNYSEKTWGAIRNFEFTPRQHFEIGEALKQMDFTAAAKMSGSRFTILKGQMAKLERALGQFMLDIHTSAHDYTEVSPPLLVDHDALVGTGQIPKLEEDLFKTTDSHYLIPTGEVPLTNLVAGEILPLDGLPLRYTTLTPCFRSEAGSAGRDTRGMMRQHQFWKVEMVSITKPDESDAEHERMTRCAETVLERLELPYRRMLLCAGDTGFSAAKTYDLEVWLPGQDMYREISSCSNCRAFQARRMNARYRKPDGKPDFVHTLNGSGVAVGRALIAVLENYQNADGSVTVPEALRPYMNGLETIR